VKRCHPFFHASSKRERVDSVMGDPLARDLAVLRFSHWEWGSRAGLRPWQMFVLFQYTDICLMIIEIRHAFFLLFPQRLPVHDKSYEEENTSSDQSDHCRRVRRNVNHGLRCLSGPAVQFGDPSPCDRRSLANRSSLRRSGRPTRERVFTSTARTCPFFRVRNAGLTWRVLAHCLRLDHAFIVSLFRRRKSTGRD